MRGRSSRPTRAGHSSRRTTTTARSARPSTWPATASDRGSTGTSPTRCPTWSGELRHAFWPHLLPIARAWADRTGRPAPWPDGLDDWLGMCHAAGQRRPTPLLLRYGAGDWNALHRDLYGELVFPLQVVIGLDEPGCDYEGGELVFVEQRPRAQSRATTMTMRRGEAVVFTTRDRPVPSARGWASAPDAPRRERRARRSPPRARTRVPRRCLSAVSDGPPLAARGPRCPDVSPGCRPGRQPVERRRHIARRSTRRRAATQPGPRRRRAGRRRGRADPTTARRRDRRSPGPRRVAPLRRPGAGWRRGRGRRATAGRPTRRDRTDRWGT